MIGLFVPWSHHILAYRVADWFAQLNNKMGGDLKKIKVVGEYMIEVWKAVGMNLDMVEFLWASDAINERPHEYWSLVMDISIKFKLSRIMRCTQIMGRDDSDLQASQIFYPCMQCADIFYLKVLLPIMPTTLCNLTARTTPAAFLGVMQPFSGVSSSVACRQHWAASVFSGAACPSQRLRL